MTRYQISLYAENLPGLFFKPNPYALLTVAAGPMEGTELGRTETIQKAKNAYWIKLFFIDFERDKYLPIQIEVFNDRGGGRRDRRIGIATLETAEAFANPGHSKMLSLQQGATLYATMEEAVKGPATGTMNLHIRGLDIKNVEAGLFGLGRSDPFFELSKKCVDHGSGEVRWQVIHRSESIDNHLNPYWEPFSLSLEALCFGNMDWDLKIEVLDFEDDGNHRLVGQCHTTPKQLMERVSVRGNADRENAFEIYKEGRVKARGLLVVVKAELVSS